MIRQVRKIRIKSLIGALDKFNIIHQHFPLKVEIFIQLEVFNDCMLSLTFLIDLIWRNTQ